VPPPSRLKLPFTFDPAALLADLARIPDAAWLPHYNPRDHEGAWTVAPLRAPVGSVIPTVALPTARDFEDGPLLLASPAFRQVVSRFECPVGMVRLLRLAPGARIREHEDPGLGFAHGEVRLHVPITTSPQVSFHVDRQPLRMAPGECWYVDVSRPHRVENDGEAPRVHLVIDAKVNPWLAELFARAALQQPPPEPAPPSDLPRLIDVILEDPALLDRLVAMEDRAVLIQEVRSVAKARGLSVSTGELESELRANQRAWLERRIL
jgi:quercetin dioxygenase-like cupin family protein